MLTVQTQGGLTLPESDLSNLLVAQKNAIYTLVHDGKYAEAEAALDVVSELWRIADYGYKIGEVHHAIKDLRGEM